MTQVAHMRLLLVQGPGEGREHTIHATDPALRIQWPAGAHILSGRDADAPTLDEVKAAGLLPTWEGAKAFVDELRRRT